MKKTVFPVILTVLALIIAVGSVTVLGPCVHADGSEAPCTGAGQAVMVDGILLAMLGILLLFVKFPKARVILCAVAALAALAGILLPGTLLPICKMDTMHCRMIMQPAMIILFAASLLASVGGIAVSKNRNGNHKA